MRTQEEIVAYLKATDAEARGLVSVFAEQALVPYLDVEHVRPFLEANADFSDWQPKRVEREAVLQELRDYMGFAWRQALNHRGISGYRSVVKAHAWIWLLGDDELAAIALDPDRYPYYGAPVLKAICEKYGFPIPTDPAAARMAAGEPCRPDCDEGCLL